MTFDLGHLFVVSIAYLLLLFLIAYATDRNWISPRIARHPLTYALSLGVYATSWSFYGSVGFAQSSGYNFLSIYIGVTLAFLLTPLLLSPILRIVRDYQLSSLADLFAFRYHSQATGVLVTLLMLAAAFPYIALQILAVTESVSVLTQEAAPHTLALSYCVTLIAFAVLFGARHISPREKHEGLVVAIAFESLVKLCALIAVGLFALFGVFGGPQGLDAWLSVNPEALERLYAPVRDGSWTTLILLSFAAAFLLPRQFHMTFSEALNERSLLAASWAFPLFLLLLNLFIPVILWAGLVLQPGTPPDFYVLGITLSSEFRLLPYIAFIGGLSAASAMMIVTTLALASMCLNHLVLPVSSYPDPSMNLYRRLLWGRRTLITIIIIAGYGFYLVLERNQGLVQLGLISFVAVLQFLPGVFGVLFWPRATRAGVIAGLLGGGAVWGVTMLLPLLARSGIIGPHDLWMEFATRPGTDPWSLATFCSLGVNACLFFVVSLFSRQSHEESQAAEACRATSFAFPGGVVVGASTPAHFEDQLARILGPQAAASEVRQALADLAMDAGEQDPGQLRRLRERIERNLSGLLGPMLSRMIVDERLQTDSGARSALAENIRLIEDRLEQSRTRLDGVAAELDQLRRYHQQVLRDLPLGACAVDDSRKVTSWNAVMERLTGLARHQVLGNIVDRLPAPWGGVIGGCLDTAEEHLHKLQVRVDGRARWFNLHKAAIAGARSAPEGTVVLLEDLTDLQTLEGELAHAERLASIGRLAAGVAHEIGNPVTAIACLAQNLHSETRDQDALSTSGAIIEQTRRISDIVQSLVSFSHSGTSLSTGSFVPLVVRECVDEAMRLVRLSRAAQGAVLHNECPAHVQIAADRPRFVQVLVNLLTNAIDASALHARVVVSCDILGDQAQVHVSDEGEGIDEQIMAQIFEPFVTTKPPGRGTGLGLSVVYRIVNEHGGNIQVDSVRGRGTLVTVSLPLARAANGSPSTPMTHPQAGMA